ncbi:hypothetical protein [Roseicyclus persicicus]|uniref:Uncharacterized protein n=1 Tax=Roseicyclus persicicus TaxID=2650661 RepID=A0A7X6JZZ3_9RHOB|nr:hypothetical protein [Roseibacterium persicicum]NKX46094.1 hypothetical protein [Roseibacterium persicicum]
MSRIAEELADQLARDTIAAAEEIGDDRLIETIAQAVGASSPTTEELFRTLVRVRVAEARARKLLEARVAAAKAAAPPG